MGWSSIAFDMERCKPMSYIYPLSWLCLGSIKALAATIAMFPINYAMMRKTRFCQGAPLPDSNSSSCYQLLQSQHSDQGNNRRRNGFCLPCSIHQLERLRSSQPTSSSSNLSGLKELYQSIDDYLQLQATQKSISNNNSIDKALYGSLRLLDFCGFTRDILSQIKEILEELQSSLRRKRGSQSVEAYMAAKKQLSKHVCKCLRYKEFTEELQLLPAL
ncbi:unnamed protein product [Linum trigynum]